MPKNSAAKIAANSRYDKKTYDQITLRVPKGQKDIIKSIAESKGLSPNGYINQAIANQIAADQPPDSSESSSAG